MLDSNTWNHLCVEVTTLTRRMNSKNNTYRFNNHSWQTKSKMGVNPIPNLKYSIHTNILIHWTSNQSPSREWALPLERNGKSQCPYNFTLSREHCFLRERVFYSQLTSITKKFQHCVEAIVILMCKQISFISFKNEITNQLISYISCIS